MKKEPCFYRWSVLAASMIFLAIGSPASGQDAPRVFGEVIDVRVVNLEVVVTGKDGGRVQGLEPEDFLVLVDKREVAIDYFTEVREGTAQARRDTAPAMVPAVTPDDAVGTHFLVFIDDYLSIALDRDRLVDRLIEQLPLLGAADRMAVVAFDGKKLEMLSNWSSSAVELTRSLEAAKERPAYGLNREARLRLSQRGRDRPRPESEYRLQRDDLVKEEDRLDDEDRLERDEQVFRSTDELRRVILAATTALRSFASPAGRRAMLLAAGGWPYHPAELVVPDIYAPHLRNELDYGPSLYRSLYDTANRLSYTLYPVDMRGFRPANPASPEHRTPREAERAYELELGRERSENALLWLLAVQTGGRAMINLESQKALAQAIGDTRSYYWLGITPSWRDVDRRHNVEVRTRDRSLQVRTRRSFSDLSRTTEVTMLVESALLFGNPPGPRTLVVKTGSTRGAGFRKMSVPIEVLIPLEYLVFLPHRDGWAADVEMRVAVVDKHGDRNDIPVIPIELTFRDAPPEGGYGSFTTSLDMRRMKHDVVVSIYDKTSGVILWTRLEVAPGPAGAT